MARACGYGKINLSKVGQQGDELGWLATDDPSFRWSGGAYVSRSNLLAIMNTERKTKQGDKDYVDGDVYLGEP